MNNSQFYLPELLAPAGNLESGISAINAGADAVYIGASKYGARLAAGNSLGKIEQLCNYAHKYYSKVYVTVNTLLTDTDIPIVTKLINDLYNIGVDAIIIQDMAILVLDLPPIAFFASTQTDNYNIEKIKFLENAGISRIILARELDLQQIKAIKKNSTVDLEYFIHGALCVSYSGKCYFSKAISNGSGNKGNCCQPCRRYFTLKNAKGKILEKNKHLLSLKDLNLTDYIETLYNAGISSFKIEGRLKDSIYVINTVSHYRKIIDKLSDKNTDLKKPSSGHITYNFISDVDKSFNRGYTEYFINGRKKGFSSPNSPKSLGKYVGKVISLTQNSFMTEENHNLVAGDGICFLNKDGLLKGTYVNKIEGRTIYISDTSEMHQDAIIYRNFDKNYIKLLSHKNSCIRKISVVFLFREVEKGFELIAFDEDKNTASAIITNEKILSNTKDTKSIILNQLSKTGSTIFNISNINIHIQNNYFFSASELNNIRRDVLGKLEAIRAKNRYTITNKKASENNDYPLLFDETGNCTNNMAKIFYEKANVKFIPEQMENTNSFTNKTIMQTRFCVRFELNICNKSNLNAESLYLEDNMHKYRLDFDCSKCEMKMIFLGVIKTNT